MSELEDKVSSYIDMDWIPQGGVAIDSGGASLTCPRYIQAMVHDEFIEGEDD